MALTPAEIQKAYRDRQKAAKYAAEDSTYPYLKETFSEYLKQGSNYSSVDEVLALAGIEAPCIDDERDPKEFIINEASDEDDPFPGAKGAVGRAEVLMGCLISAAAELSLTINDYKRQEIKARLAELESLENADLATAMQDAVKLNKILDQLNKQVRWPFSQWKVTGV